MNIFEKLYNLYWDKYKCRLEPYTHEWRRYVKKWWWVVLTRAGILFGALMWLLLFPPCILPLWSKVLILVIGVLGLTFYGWLLFHLGGYAKRFHTIKHFAWGLGWFYDPEHNEVGLHILNRHLCWRYRNHE